MTDGPNTPVDAKAFGASFKGFLEQMAAQAPAQEPPFLRRLRAHFAQDPAALPVVSERFPPSEHPNVQRALDAYLAAPARAHEVVGITARGRRFLDIGLADLVAPEGGGLMGGEAAREGPVAYKNLPVSLDEVLACVDGGLFLVRDEAPDAAPLAVLVNGPGDHGISPGVRVEVMAPAREAAEAFLAALRRGVREHNVYRGKVVSLEPERHGLSVSVSFHALPQVPREAIVLPPGVLERIERHTVGFAKHREALRASGRHLKRGLLLYGPPGTGKTFTAMHLAGRMPDRTVLLLTGRRQGMLAQTCALARLLQPATVILEDVDLIAEERGRQPNACATPLLFDLLNEMDGLAEDADVLFLLTTNRPDALEPALAARPGRIDQAVEVPLPDADGRRRLIELYGRGLELRLNALDDLVARTEGVSAAFIKELLRKAALFAADAGDGPVITDAHLEDAVHELLVEGGPLTLSLLGARGLETPPA